MERRIAKCRLMAMIDKLDIRVPGPVDYTPEFSELYAELRNDPKGPFHASRYYLGAAPKRTSRPSRFLSTSHDLRSFVASSVAATICGVVEARVDPPLLSTLPDFR